MFYPFIGQNIGGQKVQKSDLHPIVMHDPVIKLAGKKSKSRMLRQLSAHDWGRKNILLPANVKQNMRFHSVCREKFEDM